MDIEFYEIPGTGHYLCTTEQVNTSRLERFVGKNDTYDLFDRLNDGIEEADDYAIGIHTAGGTYTANELFGDALDGLEARHRQSRNSNALFTGLWGYMFLSGGINPIGAGITGWMAASTYFHHATARELGAFKENMEEHASVAQYEPLTELRKAYHDLNIEGTKGEMNRHFGRLSSFRRIFRTKETKAFLAEKGDELAEKYTTLKERAYELAEEHDDPHLKVVGNVYGMIADGTARGLPLICATRER